MENQNELLNFAKVLLGHYSNQKQAIENPKDFAHINIFFQPMPNKFFNTAHIYSEQSYDHDPWRPYRQGIHKISISKGIIIVENFEIENMYRLAGAGPRPELLNGFNCTSIKQRFGCAMHFKKKGETAYTGEVEPGCKCIVPRDGQLSYLVSEVEVNEKIWESRDRGFNIDDHKQCWGSEHGKLKFERKAFLGLNLEDNCFN